MGPYLTDPAINTIKGNFDETDIGQEGINNYIVNFKGKNLGYEYIPSIRYWNRLVNSCYK